MKKIRHVNVSEVSQALLFLASVWIKADRSYYSITLFTVYQKLKIVSVSLSSNVFGAAVCMWIPLPTEDLQKLFDINIRGVYSSYTVG